MFEVPRFTIAEGEPNFYFFDLLWDTNGHCRLFNPVEIYQLTPDEQQTVFFVHLKLSGFSE